MFASKDQFFTRSAAGYQLTRSLRFRASASAYLSRTFGTPTNNKIWTWSCWVKRGLITSSNNKIFGSGDGAANNYNYIYFGSDNLFINSAGASYWNGVTQTSNALYRDPSSWYHVMWCVDTTQATAANRSRIYVNGSEITYSSATYPAQNAACYVNANGNIGYIGYFIGVSQYTDCYMAEVQFVDGQQLTPSSFGQTDTATGVWVPKKYSGTYGNNGFYLPFTDTSSTTNLVKDSSGNGNNWTPNNISLTAGTTYDSMIDVPYCTGQINGTQPSGNYATLNPLTTSTTLSSANLNVSIPPVNTCAVSTIGVTSGKWYCEMIINSVSAGDYGVIGIGATNTTNWATGPSITWATSAASPNYVQSKGSWTFSSNTVTTTYVAGDVVGVALDLTSNTLAFYKNGTSQGSMTISVSGYVAFLIAYSSSTNTSTGSVNFGQRPFSYTPPSGYSALCAPNLASPTIKNGAGYMAATTYTGTGATKSVANTVGSTSFQPDLVWIKSRSAATNNDLFDSVRGATKYINSNTQTAQTTDANTLTAFASNGFTLGSDASSAGVNVNAATYVGWQWLGSNTTVSNTSGTITSTVCVNTTSGISIITYTGNGTLGATIGHGLGVAPDMVINKQIASIAGSTVYHKYANASPATGGLFLESTSAFTTNSGYWNNTAPTSTLITLGQAGVMNNSGVAAVVYAFATIAGYSAFGSYTGNGSADGPFVYCGFRPRFVMFKDSSTAQNWTILDSTRGPYNLDDVELYPSLANAEGSGGIGIDLVSNGFKIRTTTGNKNLSGDTYIYAAFAENPFNYANAR